MLTNLLQIYDSFLHQVISIILFLLSILNSINNKEEKELCKTTLFNLFFVF
jgi:hypothetical protein